MKILAVNGSPRGENGATYGVLKHFAEGAKEAGAEVEVVHLTKYDITHCTGCFTCWSKTPGKCVHDDDMQDIIAKLNENDALVLATPVYVDGMTGLMKNFIDRLIPLLSGKVKMVNGHARHPRRHRKGVEKLALLSVCGFPEMDNLDPLVMHVQAMARNMQCEYVGAILRPYAWAIPILLSQGIPVRDVIDAVVQSGRDLVERGTFNPDVLDIISRELLPAEEVANWISNQFQ